MRWILAVALAGCTPATTHGFRTDGLLPSAREAEGVAFLAAGAPLGGGAGIGGAGASLALGLSDHLALVPTLAGAGQTWGFDLEGRWALASDDALTVTALFGAGFVGRPRTVGVHGGMVASRRIAPPLRLVLGARVNPAFGLDDAEDRLWLHTAFGATLRPPDGWWSPVRVGIETFWEVPFGEPDALGIGALVHVSVRGPLPGR